MSEPLKIIPVVLPEPQSINPMPYSLRYAPGYVYILYGLGLMRANIYTGKVNVFGLGGGGYYPLHPGPWVFHQIADGWQCCDALAVNEKWAVTVTRSTAFAKPDGTHQSVRGFSVFDVSGPDIKYHGTVSAAVQSTCVGLERRDYINVRFLADDRGVWRQYVAGRMMDTTFRVALPAGASCWTPPYTGDGGCLYTWNGNVLPNGQFERVA